MKKFLSVIAVLSVFVLVQSCKQESATDYNNKIIAEQQGIVYKIDALKKSIENYNVLSPEDAIKQMNLAYDSVVFQIDSGLAFIKPLEGYKGDLLLKDGAEELFTSYKDIIEHEYKSIIELYKIPDALFTTEDQQKLDLLQEQCNQKLDAAFTKFSEVQKEFASKNNLEIDK